MNIRPRRLRRLNALRQLVSETTLTKNDLIFPLFVRHGQGQKNPISSMPNHYQFSIDKLPDEVRQIQDLGIPAVLLFGLPENKDATGSDSYNDNGIVQRAVQTIKDAAPDMLVISDICFCEYTDHGHCGVMSDKTGQMDLDNDATLELLTKQAVSHAQTGSDMLAPSGMIDGMVAAIRQALDSSGYSHIPIMSYAVKYASAFYGPFREAADGAPQYGNRKTYQMDPANSDEALREAIIDVDEGADILMVKPALNYLDIIYKVKQACPEVPMAAYQVSGEYSMIMAAAAQGWLDQTEAAMESLIAIKRAGADIIISYFAKEIAPLLG